MTFTEIQLVRSLDDGALEDTAEFGSKAATLAGLKRAGFPVPQGVVVTTEAIIAREYRVPAVVATGNATALLHDDQIVTVDGTAGRIQVGPE